MASSSSAAIIPEVDLTLDCCWEKEWSSLLEGQEKRRRVWEKRLSLLRPLVARAARTQQYEGNLPFGPSSPSPGALVLVASHKGVATEDVLAQKEPFLSFHYVDKLKYTFGTSFVSRESQGEFIYFNVAAPPSGPEQDDHDDDEEGQDFKKDNYFTLECKEDGIWVYRGGGSEDHQALTVSVNGVPLRIGGERALSFGDILSISKSRGGGRKKEDSRFFCDFLFKAAGSITTLAETSLEEKVMGNALLLNTILSNLQSSPTSLKVLRLVGRLWNEEALKLIRGSVVVTLLHRFVDPYSPEGSMQIGAFASSQLCVLKFSSWVICLPEDLDDDDEEEGGRRSESHCRAEVERKLLADLTGLLDPQVHNHNVTTLSLSGSLTSHRRLKMFESVLSGLSTTLTTLTLKIDNVPLSPDLPTFPSLKSLSLCLERGSETHFEGFIAALLPKVGSIQTLALTNTIPTRPMAYSYLFPVPLLRGMSSDPSGFRDLASVSILNSGDSILHALSTLQSGRLRGLHLGELRVPRGAVTFTHLRSVLETHAHFLEDLTLVFSLQTGRTRVCNINFPARLSKLRRLSIFCRFEVLQEFIGGRTVQMSFGADGYGKINYASRFPTLKKLSVWPALVGPFRGPETLKMVEGSRWKEFAPALTLFIRSDRRDDGRVLPVASLEEVDVPYLLEDEYNGDLSELEATFPNATFRPGLEEARRMTTWNSPREGFLLRRIVLPPRP